MRRAGVGPGRRIGFRGFGGGRPASFDPLADPDLAAMYIALDATDNGTTLTLPDRGPGGYTMTATGTRPAIDETGFAGQRAIDPSVLVSGSSNPLSSAGIGAALTGKRAVTVVVLCGGGLPADASGYLLRYGGSGAGDFMLRSKVSNLGQLAVTNYQASGGTLANGGIAEGRTDDDTEPLVTPKALAFVIDGTKTDSSQVRVYHHRAKEHVLVYPATQGTLGTTMSSRTLIVGSANGGVGRYMGRIAGLAIFARAMESAEIAPVMQWMRAQYGLGSATQIIWAGDSITGGTGTAEGNYRYWIQQAYESARASDSSLWGTYEAIGPSGHGSLWPEDWLAGAAGSRTSVVTTALVDAVTTNGLQPDIISPMIGRNDICLDDITAAQQASLWETLLVSVYDAYPAAKLKLRSLTRDTSSGGIFEPTILEANALGPTVVANAIAARPGMQAEWVIGPYDVATSDGTHPTAGDGGGHQALGYGLWPIVQGWL